jgi:hypothetical protein
MQRKIWALLAFTQLLVLSVSAQDEIVPERKSSHYVGLQANQLIRQIFNFSGASPAINNPYLLTYAVNANQGGAGFTAGFGYTFTETNDGDQFIDRTTTTNDVFFRMGTEKKSMLAKKVLLSIGLDIVLDRQKSETETKEKTQSQINFANATKNNGTGFGPRLGLNYVLSDKILIGTEANYYFKSIKVEQSQTNIFFETVFDPITGQQRQVRRTEENSSEEKNKRFQFNSPAVIFLIMKF